jgi:hypothetical protein
MHTFGIAGANTNVVDASQNMPFIDAQSEKHLRSVRPRSGRRA